MAQQNCILQIEPLSMDQGHIGSALAFDRFSSASECAAGTESDALMSNSWSQINMTPLLRKHLEKGLKNADGKHLDLYLSAILPDPLLFNQE